MTDRVDTAVAGYDAAWLDAARVAATVAVVLLHVAATVVTPAPLGTTGWWAGNVYDSMARWSVPAFVMISGALLLDPGRTEDAGAFYRRRVDRIAVPLVVWTVVFVAWTAWMAPRRGDEFSLGGAVEDIVEGQPYYHLWFLYMLLGLYLFVPVVRAVVRRLPRRELWWLVAVMFLLAALDEWRGAPYATGDRFFILWFLPFLGYFVCGHLIATRERDTARWLTLAVFAAAVAVTAGGCYVHSVREGTDDGFYVYGYLSVTVIPMSIALMTFFKTLSFGSGAAARLHMLAALTLGVYVLHPMLLDIVRLNVSLGQLYPWASVPLVALLLFVVSALVIRALRAVPVLRRGV